ncbi:hypothetical protein GCM10027259_59110 [Micromonospora palomenae]
MTDQMSDAHPPFEWLYQVAPVARLATGSAWLGSRATIPQPLRRALTAAVWLLAGSVIADLHAASLAAGILIVSALMAEPAPVLLAHLHAGAGLRVDRLDQLLAATDGAASVQAELRVPSPRHARSGDGDGQ